MRWSRVTVMSALLTAFMSAGCVTINIYFPAAAAERAADRIIDEVWQLKPDAAKPSSKADAAAPAAK
jgi:hypothetical protein